VISTVFTARCYAVLARYELEVAKMCADPYRRLFGVFPCAMFIAYVC